MVFVVLQKPLPKRLAVGFAFFDFAVQVPHRRERQRHAKPLRGCLLGDQVNELSHAKKGVFGVIREYTKSMFATTAVPIAAVRLM